MKTRTMMWITELVYSIQGIRLLPITRWICSTKTTTLTTFRFFFDQTAVYACPTRWWYSSSFYRSIARTTDSIVYRFLANRSSRFDYCRSTTRSSLHHLRRSATTTTTTTTVQRSRDTDRNPTNDLDRPRRNTVRVRDPSPKNQSNRCQF